MTCNALRWAPGASICFVLIVLAGVQSAHAQTQDFNVPAQSATTGIPEFARQAGIQILVSETLVRGKRTAAVTGALPVEKALTILLTGTGLVANSKDGVTFTLSATSTPTTSYNSALPSPTNSTTSESQSNVPESKSKEEERKEGLSEIVVTGTHIRGVAPVGTPIRTLDRAEIDESGYTTTEDLIQSLPQNFRGGAGGASADTNFSNGTYAGFNQTAGSGINLHGLGNTATLILIDGHRVASSGSGYFTDISTIPLSAIDHIDVLMDGASAIYGSDAIAGVVNIILKKDTSGVDVGARYSRADGGFSVDGGNVQMGSRWNTGGYTIGVDVSHENTLDASQRPFTSSIQSPTSILPPYTQTAVSAAAHQEIGDRLELSGDAQYTNKSVDTLAAANQPTIGTETRIERWSGSLGATYRITDSWDLHYAGSGGEEFNGTTQDLDQPTSEYSIGKILDRFQEQNLDLTGNLIELPGGAAKLAVGVAYRTETYEENINFFQYGTSLYDVSRKVRSAYGELRIPIFSAENAIPGVEQLTVDVSGRLDHYSDFGSTTNPKFGVSWFPLASLELRASYSTSFRAPAAGYELVNSEIGTTALEVIPAAGPGGSQVPVVILAGGRPNLQPETAINRTIGFDWRPDFVAGLKLSFDYYDITYSNQLAAVDSTANFLTNPAFASLVTYYPSGASLQSLVNAATAHGAFFYDFTGGEFGPNPLASGGYVYDGRTANLSSTDTSGYDVSLQYGTAIGPGKIDSRIDVTHIDRFVTQIAPGAPLLSEVNTVGYPASLRLRALGGWTQGPFNGSLAVNYINSYSDTSSLTPRDVSSYTTFDLAARYKLPHRLVVALAAINVFNRYPSYVVSGTDRFPGSHYDPANASPLGRLVTLQLSKHF